MKKPTRSDILLALFVVTLFVTTAIVMSYRDMHPGMRYKPRTADARMAAEYYVMPSAREELIPDDSLPVTVFAGDIRTDAKGNTVFTANGIAPTTLPQRQVNLAFAIGSLPADPEDAAQHIRRQIDVWEKQGNTITALFTDYRPRKPDFKAYKSLLETLKGTAKTKLYHVAPAIDVTWIQSPQHGEYRDLKEHASAFIVRYAGEEPEVFLDHVKNIGFAFRIILPSTTMEQNRELLKTLRQHEFFGSTILTIDQHSPEKKEEAPIRLWPGMPQTK